MKFLLDANFLLIPGRYKVRIFDQLQSFGLPELYTIRPVVDELEYLATRPGAVKRAAKLALRIIALEGITVLPMKGDADDLLYRHARRGYVVCTQDRALQQKLARNKLPCIYLRQRRLVEARGSEAQS